MSSYTKSTDFASKDALLTGNPLKVVKGTEIDDEFNAIQTAVNSKADINSPALSGTPTAPTAAAATNTTQIASTAMVQAALAQAGIIDTTQLAADAVTNAKIADNSIDSEHYVDGSIDRVHLASDVIDGTKIANDVINSEHYVAGSIDAEHLASDSVTSAKIASSVALAGNPTTTTQSFGNNSTRIATTAFVQSALQAVYPVGSIYINAASTSNPNTLLGFGTWVAFGAGRVLVGQDISDSAFNTLEETGGSADAVVVSHTHSVTDSGHSHTFTGIGFGDDRGVQSGGTGLGGDDTTETATTGISIASSGVSGTDKNLQPYIVVKMWKRTA